MAEKEAKKPDKTEAPAKGGDEKKGEGKKGGIGALLGKTPVMIGGVMLLEAVVLFAGFKFLMGGPKSAAAVEAVTGEVSHGGGRAGRTARPVTVPRARPPAPERARSSFPSSSSARRTNRAAGRSSTTSRSTR